MPVRSGVLSLKLNSPEAATVRKALAADQRIRLLEMLTTRTMNVNEIAAALGVSHPTASMHVRALQEAGLLESASASTDKGSEKRCWTAFSRIVLELEPQANDSTDSAEEVTVPVGLYSAIRAVPPCGLLGRR
jgi:predicted transcriptional regulator